MMDACLVKTENLLEFLEELGKEFGRYEVVIEPSSEGFRVSELPENFRAKIDFRIFEEL